ncbi:MAG: hypothetical protein K2I25_09585 [Muribaculaceae bacterium]|nr:hypothetical protein [Muribaculaceae bacterium]
MNKYLLLLILPLLSFTLIGCDDEDDVIAPDLKLFAGTWEVVDQGNQELLERNCILNITSSQIHERFGGYQGFIETYFITVNEIPKHDRVFSWSIREMENNQPLLDIVYQGELDSDDTWDGNYYYKITKLTDTHMWWQVNTNGDNSTIKFRRRNDIHID